MDKIIYFLILAIVLIILGHCILKNREKFSFGFSPNDVFYQHAFDKNQRHSYDLFVEDENLTLLEPRLNNVLRDVKELMDYKSEGGDIYEMTRVKKRDYNNLMSFW